MWRDSDLICGDFDELLVAIMHVREHTSDVAFALDAIERGHPEEGGGSADEGYQEGEKRGEATGRMPHDWLRAGPTLLVLQIQQDN